MDIPVAKAQSAARARTEAQREASRRNGSRSRGPVTSKGKSRSALNAVRHGLRGSGPHLLPGETEEHQRLLDGWKVSLRPNSPAEVEIVERVAMVSLKIHRLDHLEHAELMAAVEEELSEGETRKKLDLASMILQGATVLASTVEGSPPPADLDAARPLVGGARAILAWSEKLDGLPLQPQRDLAAAIDDFTMGSCLDNVLKEFTAIGAAARGLEAAVLPLLQDLQRRVEEERESLIETMLVDHPKTKLLNRYRVALDGELARLLELFGKIRELARGAEGKDAAPAPALLRVASSS